MATNSRRWDGEPETEADTRLFDLRESGYTGPIDSDGYAVTSGEDAAILKRMADQRGEDTSWWTGGDTPSRPSRVWLLLLPLAVFVLVAVLSHPH